MEPDKDLKERDFHHGEGHAIPTILKIAWCIFWVAAITYLARWMVPDLMVWLKK